MSLAVVFLLILNKAFDTVNHYILLMNLHCTLMVKEAAKPLIGFNLIYPTAETVICVFQW